MWYMSINYQDNTLLLKGEMTERFELARYAWLAVLFLNIWIKYLLSPIQNEKKKTLMENKAGSLIVNDYSDVFLSCCLDS